MLTKSVFIECWDVNSRAVSTTPTRVGVLGMSGSNVIAEVAFEGALDLLDLVDESPCLIVVDVGPFLFRSGQAGSDMS
jgi:hypothetical protein